MYLTSNRAGAGLQGLLVGVTSSSSISSKMWSRSSSSPVGCPASTVGILALVASTMGNRGNVRGKKATADSCVLVSECK